MKYFITVFLLLLPAVHGQSKSFSSLKVLTLNVWSGLDYVGTFKMGEYEPDSIREKRFSLLVNEIKKLQPDILFLQEVNPVGLYSSHLADSLNYDEVHQVCIGGIKFGPLGIPSNLKEGNAILARKELNLIEKDPVKLSGGFGLFGDALTVHFNEAIFLVPAVINVNGTEILLLNTHLYSPSDEEGKIRRMDETESLLKYIHENENLPIILGGDFNAIPDSPEILKLKSNGELSDVFSTAGSDDVYTWDPVNNTNIVFSTTPDSGDPSALREAEFDKSGRRIDYIFVNKNIGAGSIKNSEVVFNKSGEGLFVSDHYGVITEIDLSGIPQVDKNVHAAWDGLPIASYDTDFGFGAGLKAFFLNQLGYSESIDLTGYYSTKGERWYRFVFSVPDFEVRQQTEYPLAFDFIADYDKTNSNFFGVGNNSRYEDQETYFIEPVEIKLQLSSGISHEFVIQGGLKFRYARHMQFEKNSRLNELGGLNSSVTRNYGLYTTVRYDTRNSFINPSRGLVLQGDLEFVPDLAINNTNYSGAGLTLQYYYKMFYPKTVLAVKFNLQGRFGEGLSVQNLLSVGGNGNLRGYVQNRLIDKVAAVFNTELRFPLYWRFGGIVGLDAGNVWHEPRYLNFKDWKINPTTGVRFYFDTFVVRLDIGFSSESTGFYLNFGQLF